MAITITPDLLKQSAIKHRKELLLMITIALESSLQHMTPRLGVQYKEGVGKIASNAQLGPYDKNRKGNSQSIVGRYLEVFLGSVIEEFEPNQVWQSIYGSLVLHGKSLADTEITKAILASVILSISEKLNMALFPAVRNDAGTTSMDLFNGFDTIA